MKGIISSFGKWLAIVLMIVGIAVIALALKEIYETKVYEDKATKEAEALLKEAEQTPISKKQFKPDFGEAAGMLVIDKIGANLPIVEGTNEDDLMKGVGHYEGTAYPLEEDQIVLSGHRDTVFTKMGEVEIGDIMTVRMPYGDFDYEVVSTKIVDADDLTIIVPHDEETLTVTTCYPFTYIGKAPDRYIIDAKPVYDKSAFSHMLEDVNE